MGLGTHDAMTPEVVYSYLAPSRLSTDHDGEGAASLRLALATSGGQSPQGSNAVAAAHPFFLSGFVERPTIVRIARPANSAARLAD